MAEWSNAAVLKTVVPQGTGGSNPSSSAYKLPIVNSDFFKDVYEIVKLIPHGKVSSYGAIAKYLGTTNSARVVGWAMNNSHHDSSIPAHRVVNKNGLLTGKHHFPGEKTMESLLKKEGIIINNNRIQNFDNVFWDPIKELEL